MLLFCLFFAWGGLSPCQPGMGSALAPPRSPSMTASDPKRFKSFSAIFRETLEQPDGTCTGLTRNSTPKDVFLKPGICRSP